MKKMTQKQVNKKYYWKYVQFMKQYCYESKQRTYEIVKTSRVIMENTTLWQDVGTSMEYCR